jgi:hypothetical protein
LVCTTFLVFLGFSAVPQESERKGADTESGQLTFNNACRTCHTIKEGDNRLGPNFHNIIGRKAGSLPNYGYSSAMKGADFVWDKEKLDRFIWVALARFVVNFSGRGPDEFGRQRCDERRRIVTSSAPNCRNFVHRSCRGRP